ncbi:MAG: 50S ribosome-binding GTPase [Clostridiales bacterium]|nr:50S ribosome-binding GTPase [Clostridiales bacterium]
MKEVNESGLENMANAVDDNNNNAPACLAELNDGASDDENVVAEIATSEVVNENEPEKMVIKFDELPEDVKMALEAERCITHSHETAEQSETVDDVSGGNLETEQSTESKKSIFELLEEDIMSSDLPLHEKNRRLSRLIKMRERKVNIMLVGATGSGKSSTINALFNMEVAKVGVGVDPETDLITSYVLDNLTIWDTPGLGDGVEADEKYNNLIIKKLSEMDENGDPLIDLVLVVLDASSKDLGTSYELINNVIIPCLGNDKEGRILIGINQADVAMKGKHWDSENNIPDEVLLDFLKKKAISVQKRIEECTGVSVRPIYYCAGYKEEGEEQCKPYNLTKLLYYIIRSIPKDKRLAIADNINVDEDKWLHDDEEEDYKEKSKIGFLESIGYCMGECAETGSEIGGAILGIPGTVVGYVVGGFCGAVKGFFENIFG